MDKSWRVIFAFVGIFAAGLVAGILVAPRLFDNMIEHRAQRRPGGRPQLQIGQPLGPQLFRFVTEKLDLTAEQQAKIRPIEARTTEEIRRLRRESQRSTEEVLEKMHGEISAILTPEQRVTFEAQIAAGRERIRQKIQQEQEGRGRGGPGGRGGLRDNSPASK